MAAGTSEIARDCGKRMGRHREKINGHGNRQGIGFAIAFRVKRAGASAREIRSRHRPS
jgi:hypothetical protein